MNKSNLTIVSGLFDIGRGNLSSGFNRSFEHYKESFVKLLKINHQLVLYVTEDLNDFVWQYRSKENTRIINKTLDDLRKFPFYNKIQEIRVKPEWIGQAAWLVDATQTKLELYNPLVMSKQFFLNDATLFNFFNTKYFLWLDGGLANTIGNPEYYFDESFEEKIIPHLDKMMYVAFPYQKDAPEVHGFTKTNLNNYAGTVTEYVCRGGMFGGNKSSINEINDIYYHLCNDSMNQGLMGTEESIFTIISYKYKDKCNVNMIEPVGMISKFLDELKQQKLPEIKREPLAFYFLTFNTPKQFEITVNAWKNAYPDTFASVKKYVLNNSNDISVDAEYKRLFAENNIEEYKSENNLGITGGRQWVAEHFDKSTHDYYVFIEEDMQVYQKPEVCPSGFTTYQPELFEKSIEILNSEQLDFLRLTFSEFFGDSFVSWSYINNPQSHKDRYHPPKEGYMLTKRYATNSINKTKVNYLGMHKQLPYAVGCYHYSNWPILFNKQGNKKVFLDTSWVYICEQTLSSHVGMLWEEGKIKIGCLLASPILHDRSIHYAGEKRRENATYTN